MWGCGSWCSFTSKGFDHVHTSRIDAVPKRFYYYDAFRDINRSNSTTLKKVERSDFSEYISQSVNNMKRNKETGKMKFSSKSSIFWIVQLQLTFSVILVILHAMLHVSGLLKPTRFNHIWTLPFWNIPQVQWTGYCEALTFWNKNYPRSVNIVFVRCPYYAGDDVETIIKVADLNKTKDLPISHEHIVVSVNIVINWQTNIPQALWSSPTWRRTNIRWL